MLCGVALYYSFIDLLSEDILRDSFGDAVLRYGSDDVRSERLDFSGGVAHGETVTDCAQHFDVVFAVAERIAVLSIDLQIIQDFQDAGRFGNLLGIKLEMKIQSRIFQIVYIRRYESSADCALMPILRRKFHFECFTGDFI